MDFAVTISMPYLIGLLLLVLLAAFGVYIYLQALRGKASVKNSLLQRAFDTLKRREQMLSLIYENSHDFIALIKPFKGKFIITQLPADFLADIEKHSNHKREEVIGQSMEFLYGDVLQFTEEEKQWRFDKLNKVIQSLEPHDYEENFKRPDLNRGWAMSSLIPIVDKGRCDFILYVSRDISKEKEARQQLNRTLNLFQSLVENNPAAIMLFNNSGKIEMVNRRFEEYYGYTQEEIRGHDALKITPNEHHELLMQVRKKLRDEKRFVSFGFESELKAMRKDGTTFNVALAISPVKIEDEFYTITVVTDITPYIETQRALIDSKAQIQSIVDNLPGMLYRLNTDEFFTLNFISGNSEHYLGISYDEIAEQSLRPRDVIPEEHLEKVRSEVRWAFEQNTRAESTFPVLIKNKMRWLNTRFKPTKLDDGKQFIDGLLLDVTDQVENEERLKMAIEGAQQGMWDWNIQRNTIISNTLQANMIGYAPNEIENTFQWWAAQVHPEDVERVYHHMIRHLKGEIGFFEAEYRLKTKLGVYKWILIRGRVIERNAEGRAMRALGIHLDVDERKKTEIALIKSRSRLQTLVSNLPGMVYRSAIANDFAISFASQGATSLTGYPPEEFMSGNVSIFRLIKESYRDGVRKEVEQAIKEKRPYVLIYEIETNGGGKWLYDKGQELEEGYLEGFITDITERVEAEERIIQTIIETEDRERTRIARELHDNLGQKLTTASLNFNALKTLVEEEQELNDRVSKGLNYLTDAIKDAREISHNLMPRSIEDFGFVLSVESLVTDLNRLSDTTFEFYHNLKERQLSNTIGVHLYRITQEAVNNILKYAEASSAIIQLMAYDDVIIWSVEDDGKGFDMAVLKEKQHFGLDSMKHRAQMLSGNVEINSFIGKGTTITVEIPVKKHYFNG